MQWRPYLARSHHWKCVNCLILELPIVRARCMEILRVKKGRTHDCIDIYGDIKYSACYLTFFDESYYSKWKCESPLEKGREYSTAYV